MENEYLRRRRDHTFKEMLRSLDLFEQAEMLFNWRTDHFRELHGIESGEPMTVEALIDRKNDEQWQVAVADCRYYRDRAQMYAAVHERLS